MKKYLVSPTIITILFAAAYYLDLDTYLPFSFHREFPGLIFFFFGQSLIVAWMFFQAEKTQWETPIYALGAITFRLLTGLFYLVILFTMKLEDMKMLMIQFVVLYLVYLIFELFAVLPNLRRN